MPRWLAALAGAFAAALPLPAAAPIAEVWIETGNSIPVLKTGEEDRLALRFRNASGRRQQFSAAISLEDFPGARLPLPARNFDLAAGETAAWRLPAPAKLGIHWVHYTLTPANSNSNRASAESVSGRRSFAYLKPAGPTSGPREGFRFGVAYWATGSDDPRTALATALCGADIYRFGGFWQSVEPREGQWNWDRVDRIHSLFAAQNVELQLMLCFTPAWAATPMPDALRARIARGELRAPKSEFRTAPRSEAWRRFVAETARHFRGRVRYWEIWNEPDWAFFYGTTDQYLEMLRIAHEELKRVDPANQVMTGGFAVAGKRSLQSRPNPDLTERVLRDGQEWFDLHAHHEHGSFERFVSQIDGNVVPLREQLLRSPKPLYFTETGQAMQHRTQAAPVITEREQAGVLVQKLVFAWSRGAVAYNWFCIVDNRDGDYGLVTSDFQPKPLYPAFNTLVTMLRGKQLVRQVPRPHGEYVFLFADGAEQVVVAWKQPNPTPGASLVMTTDAPRSEIVDLMGNCAPLARAGEAMITPIGGMPVYVVLRGGTKPPEFPVDAR